MGKERTVVYVSGVWDLFHIGHLNKLKYAKSLGDFLVVGLNTDEKVQGYKHRLIIPFDQRRAILEAIRYVDFVGASTSLSDTRWQEYFKIDIYVVDPNYWDRPRSAQHREALKGAGLQVKYVVYPRTPGVYTTKIMEVCYEEKLRMGSMGSSCLATACGLQDESWAADIGGDSI